METKITIIEGPPPVFEMVQEGWAMGLIEGPNLADLAITRLRTFNGRALVERCHRAWRNHQTMNLEFRSEDGLTHEIPVVAIRSMNTDDGPMLVLWVRFENDDVELELDYEDDFDDEGEDEDFDSPADLF